MFRATLCLSSGSDPKIKYRSYYLKQSLLVFEVGLVIGVKEM
jgi:hypothetical protein